MAETETALDQLINGQGWAEGAASRERISNFLDRKFGGLALAAVEVEDFDDELFEDAA